MNNHTRKKTRRAALAVLMSAANGTAAEEAASRGGRSKFVRYGYHDQVNLCATYASLVERYGDAERACDRAIAHRPVSTLRPSGGIAQDRWVAYANRGVLRAVAGDIRSAEVDLAAAQRKGGEAGAIAHNLARLERLNNTGMLLSANERQGVVPQGGRYNPVAGPWPAYVGAGQ